MTEALRVLVVDDEPGMRYAVVRALRDFKIRLPDLDHDVSFDVQQAGSGEEALSLIDVRVPDIMLLDHKMGGMSGLDVLNELHRRERDILTIMITAFATLETAVRATKSGAFDFIPKPFTPDELKETIRKATVHLVVQRHARKLAAEKRRVRFEFISVLGHELKAPLSAIEGYLNIMRGQSLGGDLAAYMPVIDRCLARGQGMRKLIMDLLDMTRIESGEKRRELGPIDVRELARSSLEMARPTAEERQITVELHAHEPVPMTADAGEIEIVLNNLLTNAVKYNRDGGRVDIEVRTEDDHVVIKVTDTGIGLSREEAAKLFHDFVRIKNEQTRNIAGSGLGLSLVKKLAVMYGGDAAVASQPGVGSTFTVSLQREYKVPADQDAA